MLMRTPLHGAHQALGARMVDFGGWDMPVSYGSQIEEHHAVRRSAGMFDVSHMCVVDLGGSHCRAFLRRLLANDIDKLQKAGKALYSCMLNASGGVIDDLIVYKWADDGVFIIPNASNAATVIAALRAAAPASITVDDQHLTHGIIAVQGPKSDDVMRTLGFPCDHDYMSMEMARWNDAPVVVCRTGYTGEHGFELVAPNEVLVDLWDAAVAAAESVGGLPAGLGARDTLRTEMGYPLHGQDISPVISPVTAGLGWAIGWDKPAFAGREALLAEKAAGPARRLRGILANDRGIPRAHMNVHAESLDGAVIGEVVSGTFSPTLKQGIGLALIDSSVQIGDTVIVDVRGRASSFTVAKPPFVQPSTR